MSRKRKKVYPETTALSVSAGHIAWVALILVMVFAGLVRYRLLAIPLERDEGEYAYAGQLILEGIPPYQEVYNMKLPGIYAAYAVLLAVFGQTHQGIHTGLLVINEATIVLVFLLAKRLLNSSAAAVSAAAFALFSVSGSMDGVFANAEHFVIVFAVAGLLVMLQALTKGGLRGLFVAGVLLGVSFTMKQHGLAFGAVAVFYLILDTLFQRPAPWRKLIGKVLSLAAGMTAVIVCLCLVMIWAGVFEKFWFWTVDYARAYVSNVTLKEDWENFINTSMPIVRSSPLLWAITGLGLLCLATKQINRPAKQFLLLYAILSFFSICPGFYFRSHYFVLLLPCAGLLAGAAVYVLSKWLSRFSFLSLGVPVVLIAICFCQAVYQQRDFMFRMTPFEVCRTAYWPNPFLESLEIAAFIRSHTTPNDTIAILGSEPQIFFYSQRRSAGRYIYMYPLMENHSFALQMQKDFIRETEAKNPKYLVFVNVPFSWLRRSDSHNLLFEWANQYQKNFRPAGTIELYDDRTIYYWPPQVKWPVSSKEWIAVFERTTDR